MAWLGLLAGALWLIALHAQGDDAKPGPPELKVSVAVGPAYALGQAAEKWAQRIGASGDAGVALKVYPGAVLSSRDPALEFAALRNGAVDLAIGSSLFWSGDVPALRAVGLPFLAPEPAQLDALATGPVGDELQKAVERSGVVPLALAPLGHRVLAVRPRAVRTPADVAGLKVRIAFSPALTPLYGALGAQPLTMPFAAAQAAFASGAVDAQDASLDTLAGMRADMLGMKWVLQWGAVAEIAVFAVNRSRWIALTDAQRALLHQSATAGAKELTMLSRQENDAALEALRKGGITAIRLTAAGRAPFVAATREVYDAEAKEAGIDLVHAAEAAVKAVPQ